MLKSETIAFGTRERAGITGAPSLCSPSLVKQDASRLQRSAIRVPVAQRQAERADPSRAFDSHGGEGHRIAVVGSGADHCHAAGRAVEDDRQDLRRLEVHVRVDVPGVYVFGVVVLAAIFIHREARLARAGAVDVTVAVGLVAGGRRSVLDRGLEVVAADAVDLERYGVSFRGRVRLQSVLDRGGQRVTAD